jgi:predicted dehydrogenase
MSDKKVIRVGLIGSGFMGKAHAFAFNGADRVFDLSCTVELLTLVDISEDAAKHAAASYSFKHSSANWRDIVSNPVIELSQ